MSREHPTGSVTFEHVTKQYRLGKPRAFIAAAVPFGSGLGRGPHLSALDDVSFHIEPGESFALMGANGAGKSTALKCLGGVTAPTHGRVRRGGRVVALIELGIGFHPDLTGVENARFAATIAGMRGAAAREVVDRAVEFAEIDRFLTTPVKRYSSGMYARLSFGIAASLPADILIVDEILAVGDLAFQRKCYQHLGRLRSDQGVTLVFVSHNEWVLKETCKRGVLLDHGRIRAEGTVNELLDIYHAGIESAGARRTAPEGKRIHFHEVDLVPEGLRTLATHGELTIRARVEVAEGVPEPVIGFALHDRQARTIFAAYSDEQGLNLGPGTHIVEVHAHDLPLLPGPYRAEMFAFERGLPQGEDSRKLDIEVEASLPSDWEHGLIHINTTWTAGSDDRS